MDWKCKLRVFGSCVLSASDRMVYGGSIVAKVLVSVRGLRRGGELRRCDVTNQIGETRRNYANTVVEQKDAPEPAISH